MAVRRRKRGGGEGSVQAACPVKTRPASCTIYRAMYSLQFVPTHGTAVLAPTLQPSTVIDVAVRSHEIFTQGVPHGRGCAFEARTFLGVGAPPYWFSVSAMEAIGYPHSSSGEASYVVAEGGGGGGGGIPRKCENRFCRITNVLLDE